VVDVAVRIADDAADPAHIVRADVDLAGQLDVDDRAAVHISEEAVAAVVAGSVVMNLTYMLEMA
jgi:hypothetical protein